MSDLNTEMLILTLQDVHRMQIEFTEYFDALMDEERKVLQKLLKIKLDVIMQCQNN
jgi:hypothetical protein